MEHEFDDLPPELQDALARMLVRASGEEGRNMAHAVIKREGEIWTLVQAVLQEDTGSADALNSLWEKIRKEIRNTIGAVLYRKDKENVDEVEQQTFLEVLRKLTEFSIKEGTFLVWAKGIARGQARWRRNPNVPGKEIDPPPVRPNQEGWLPPSPCYNELLSWIQDREPHHAIVFLLHRYLGWRPANIAIELGEKTIGDLASLVVRLIREEVKGLKNPAALFARLLLNAKALEGVKLMDLYGEESANDAVSRWSNGVGRWMSNRVIGGAKRLLTGVCELRAGAHERLTFLWSRFLRRTLANLILRADDTLFAILDIFRSGFSNLSDLKPPEVAHCTEPLRDDMAPGKTLAQCSRSNLAEDLPVWRERIQNMVAAKCKDWNVVAYAYLCGALPGIVGPAKGGVA